MHALLPILIALLAIGAVIYIRQRYQAAARRRRHAALHAKREEEERIWAETMGHLSPGGDHPGDGDEDARSGS